MNYTRKLILENGEEYFGFAFGADENKVCEIVFNTSMVGYQEILSDPSYTDQAVVITYPLIGNYGMAAEDYETETPTISALIVREYNPEPSSFRSKNSLEEIMREYGITGICGVDTRKLNRKIRDHGSMKVLITDASVSLEEGMKVLNNEYGAAMVLHTKQGSREDLGRPTKTPQENKKALMEKLGVK